MSDPDTIPKPENPDPATAGGDRRPSSCSAVFLGRLWRIEFAEDGKWETVEPKKHIRRHLICLDQVTSTDGRKIWCVVVGRRKLTWGRIPPNTDSQANAKMVQNNH